MPSISVSTSRVVTDPKVFLMVDPIARNVVVEVVETCPTCSGYGSPCGQCHGEGRLHHTCGIYDDKLKMHTNVENTLAKLLGPEAALITVDTLSAFVSANSG